MPAGPPGGASAIQNRDGRTSQETESGPGVRNPDTGAEAAEQEGHHPDLHLTGYRNVAVELTTHAIDGLSENDFILAAKINELPVQRRP